MRIFLTALTIVAGVIETVFIGVAYFGATVQPAQTAFTLLVTVALVNFLYVLSTGKPIAGDAKVGPRVQRFLELLSRASLVFLVLGAFGGQRWALGWAFWIEAASVGLLALVLVFLGAAVAVKGGNVVASSAPKVTDWRAKV